MRSSAVHLRGKTARAGGGVWAGLCRLSLLVWGLTAVAAAKQAAPSDHQPEPGAPGGPGLALKAAKILTLELDGRTCVDNGVLLVKEGKIVGVDSQEGFELPAGFVLEDLGEMWLSPGMIDLHNHTAQSLRDLSETAFLTNPGMRASCASRQGNPLLRKGLAGGVTCVLYIPGSATNMGGQGYLLRTHGDHFEEALVRDPGSLKLAQAGNPEGRGPWFPGRSFMNWNTRSTFRRGVAYAKRWREYEEGRGERPQRDLQFDIFRSLLAGETQVSTHTQIYQVVEMTLTMVAEEFGLPVYIDHGTFDGWRAAPKAEELGVPAILGPRQITRGIRAPGFAEYDQDGAIFGVAAKYQEQGHTRIGFNTDCVGGMGVGQEELSLQAAMGVHYGFDDSDADALRGVTIIPAVTAGIDDRMGSLSPGCEATLLATHGDPVDPRVGVERIWMRGRTVYDAKAERLW